MQAPASPVTAATQPPAAPTPDQFRARHAQVADRLRRERLDILIVASLPNIAYLTGFASSAGLLLVSGDHLYLLLDSRYTSAAAEAKQAGRLAPAVETIPVAAAYDRELVAYLAARNWRRIGFESAHVVYSRFEHWRRQLAQHDGDVMQPGQRGSDTAAGEGNASTAGAREWIPVEQAIEAGRLVKDAHEIATLREAGRRLSEVARLVTTQLVKAGRPELDIAADIDWQLRRAGFTKPAFDTIVASGPNAALPHAVPTARVLIPGDLVVLDFGGVYSGYCVDLTRTVGVWPVSPDARRLFDIVFQAHAAAVQAAGRPGAVTGDVDDAARQVITGAGYGERFGHGTGHGLGLEVHEAPRITRRSPEHPGTDRLLPGMVFTIEPGIYVPGLGGVRIEDDLLVTRSGGELLTDAPREWGEC